MFELKGHTALRYSEMVTLSRCRLLPATRGYPATMRAVVHQLDIGGVLRRASDGLGDPGGHVSGMWTT